jgi:hypothetical protein
MSVRACFVPPASDHIFEQIPAVFDCLSCYADASSQGPALESLVTRGWSLLVREQSFALRNPSLDVRAILQSGNDDSSKGLQKVARVLLASKSAVRVNISDTMLKQLRNAAK